MDRSRASLIGFNQAGGDTVIAFPPVPAGYHWIVTAISAWRTVQGALNVQNYDTIASGIFIAPPSVALPTANLQAIQNPNLIHVPKNMDLFFEGVPEIFSAVTAVSRARIDAPCNGGIIIPSLAVLVAVFAQGNAANPLQPGNGVMSIEYVNERNC